MTFAPPSLLKIETQIYSGDYSAAVDNLDLLLTSMDRGGTQSRYKKGASNEDALTVYTRLSAVIGALVANPRVIMDFPLFVFFMKHKRTISSLFRVTSFGNMDHLVALGSVSPKGAAGQVSQSSVYKGIFAASADSKLLNPREIIRQLPPREACVFWVSLLDRDYFLSETEDEKREEFVNLANLVDQNPSIEPLLFRVANVWMNCSYVSPANKHELKRSLNQIFRTTMKEMGISEPSISPTQKTTEKPKLLVLAEQFRHRHAMFRCYSAAILKLKESFSVVLVSFDETIDEVSRGLFDHVESFPIDTPLKKIVGRVIKQKADVIYYPSIGMQTWTVATSQLRLAPVQLMTLGHPATSMSDAIDYALIPDGIVGDPECFSERVISLSDDAIPLVKHPEFLDVDASIVREDPDVVKIAIPSNGNKLTRQLIECLENVYQRVSRPIEYHFFPNLPEILQIELENLFERKFPYVVHAGTDYVSYMNLLNQCDLQLSPFPFGNSNGYMDGLLLGLPIVSMDGPEVHSRIDNFFGRKAGLPDFCLTEDKESYVAAIERLVQNDKERVDVSEHILRLDLDNLFYGDVDSENFPQTVSWLYNNHERILADGRKWWRPTDRLASEA